MDRQWVRRGKRARRRRAFRSRAERYAIARLKQLTKEWRDRLQREP
jgi:hypothetical protein